MQFTDADLQEFIEIWREEFQESISMEEARHSASMLMELYLLLLGPLSEPPPQSSEGSRSDH